MDRKSAIRAYKEAATPMGVFAVRNRTTGRSFVGSSTNLPAMLNRQRFQLDHEAHRSRELQQEWNSLGAEAFTIETLDTLEPRKDSPADPAEDLKELEAMWREKLAESGFYK